MKAILNSRHTKDWLEPIGKLVLNFAAVEAQTYLWLGDHGSEEKLFPEVIDWKFKRRVDKVQALVESKITNNQLKSECHEVWSKALEIATFRNAVVHNPIVFGWSTGREEGPPDIVGIPDIGHLSNRPQITKKVASLADLNSKVDETAAVAARLFQLRERCNAGS